MAKHYSSKRRYKYVFLALACAASFSLTGIMTACKEDSQEEEDDKKTSVEDTQLLKNGNFEYFTVPDGDKVEYLINTPTNWTSGGTSSYSMSGIIGTSDTAWAALTASDLKDRLDYNNDLDSDDDDYKDNHIDFNGMTSDDILYKDTYAALNTDESDENYADATALIENPGTHYGVQKKSDGSYYYTDGNGQEVAVYTDDNGGYFLDEDCKQGISNILMLHNYATSHNGIAQNYSSVSVELPANTAAEISVWVKTAYLKYDQGKEVTQDRGASITVTQTAGSSALDNFSITNINTEKLIGAKSVEDSNGWVEYTVYINACDFASTTVTVQLGLGATDATVEGYAFFDDVSVTKYISLDKIRSYTENETAIETEGAKCDLASDESEKIFRTDVYERNGGNITNKNFSESTRYLIDLASQGEYLPVSFGTDVTANLTVDSDNYVSSTYTDKINTVGLNIKTLSGVKLPAGFKALQTNNDLLAIVKADYQFKATDFTNADEDFKGQISELNSALAKVTGLPNSNADTDNNMLVMLSAYGAAYTASVPMSIEADGYRIISFWVKTSDMDGNTAATVKISQDGKSSNSASLSVDSTGVTTDIDDDNKNIYDGWVQCFFFVHNDTDEAKNFTIDFSLGNTTIKDTAVSSYVKGWVALANMQTLEIDDEDIFALTGSGTYAASLTLSEDDDTSYSVFDEVYGSQSKEIENGIVNPSTYSGVNGGSSSVVNNEVISLPFDDVNTNPNAGLINKDYVENYSGTDWFKQITTAFNNSATDAITAWNEIFGVSSQQPLVIINNTRDYYIANKSATADTFKNYYIKNDDGEFEKVAEDAEFDADTTYYSLQKVINYGFMGSEQTLVSDSYATVSVRVKVSKGAVAYIYLTEATAEKKILSFTAPDYTFLYDEDGNVIKEELDSDATLAQQRANILYSLRDDGLYEDANGKLFANTYNYTRLYKDSTVAYYDAEGNRVAFEDIVSGQIYYKADGSEADCYLVTTDGNKVYEFKDGKYYYMVEGAASSEVSPFDTAYAKYDYTNVSEDYKVVIDGKDDSVADKWINVTFVIHSGSESKSYRLELWSGTRDSYGVNADGTTEIEEGSDVLFDYSYNTVSESNFDSLRSEYESEIILAYRKLLTEKGVTFKSNSENITYYEKLAAENGITEAELANYEVLNNYKAYYYTFTLYDSVNYKPFNAETADDSETDYDYSISDYSETLAYLSVKDDYGYTVFADYSAINQSISLGTVDDDTDDTDEETENDTTVWLLISSIVLVVVLLFTMLSIFLRDLIRKHRRNKSYGKNNYQQRNRIIRRLHINKETYEEVDKAPDADTDTETTVEDSESNKPADENATAENKADETSQDDGNSDDVN